MRDRREKEKRAKTREEGSLEKEEIVSMRGGDRVGKEEGLGRVEGQMSRGRYG